MMVTVTLPYGEEDGGVSRTCKQRPTVHSVARRMATPCQTERPTCVARVFRDDVPRGAEHDAADEAESEVQLGDGGGSLHEGRGLCTAPYQVAPSQPLSRPLVAKPGAPI